MQITVLCEDQAHETFIRHFMKQRNKRVYIIPYHKGKGSGEQHVREKYRDTLTSLRSSYAPLIVMIDGDRCGVDGRIRQLENECPREPRDNVAILVPTRDIEEWFEKIGGEANRRPAKRAKECAKKLWDNFCRGGSGNLPDSDSLRKAREEYKRLRL